MNDQERQVIADIFRRLEQVANQPRDPEAEAFIADRVRQQPYAPYAMAQALFVQEQALANLHAENEALRTELENARRQPQQGSFLSGLFGGGARPPEPDYREPPRQASPWGQPSPQPVQQPFQQPPFGAPQGGGMVGGAPGPWGGMQQRSGGGFLQGAISTAAGVAGGVMIANALSHAFGGAGAAAQSALGDKSALADLGGTQGNDAGNASNASITDALYPGQQDDQNNQNNQDDQDDQDDWDMGGDNGDGGDWT
ncbi:DUF2076 domain-containing protein [Microvirga sp. 2TAF3]|uniref:DUF2076 domain-containing protein n=1 Tax=Microvirga sp. 2TAF3 TaxID=3233014 RepID=UPI003F9CA544